MISPASLEKFAKTFMVSGNINLINDVMKALNRSGWRISQVMILVPVVSFDTCFKFNADFKMV